MTPAARLALNLSAATTTNQAFAYMCDALEAGCSWADARTAVNAWADMRATEIHTITVTHPDGTTKDLI